MARLNGLPIEVRLILQANPVPETGCIEWAGINGAKPRKGKYHCVEFEGKSVYVHIVAWRLFKGEIPDGLFVLHKCDNSACFNVDHLYLGTKKQNRKDFMERNASAKALLDNARKASVVAVRNFWRGMSDEERTKFCQERAAKQAEKFKVRRAGNRV